jgi:hypothetical protein
MTAYAQGDINLGEMALRTVGETGGAVGDIIGEVVDPLIPEFVKEGIGHVIQGAMDTGPAKVALKWMEDNPRVARNLVSGFNASGLIGGGSLAAGGRAAVNRLAGPKSHKGMVTAPFNNYIDDFYGMTSDATGVEELLGKGLSKVHPRVPEAQGAAATRKIVNTADTVATGAIESVRDMVSPRARAMWGGGGISRGGQEIIRGHLDDIAQGTGARSKPKAVGEAIYQGHMGAQSGRVGPTAPALQNTLDKSFLEPYTKNAPGQISGWMGKHSGYKTGVDGKMKSIDMGVKDRKFIEDYVNEVWEGADKVVMKQPAIKESGDHKFDVFSNKSPASSAMTKVFKELHESGQEMNVDTLASTFQKYADASAAKVAKDPTAHKFRVVKVDSDGVWLHTSKPGSAIVEGGVNMLYKVKPDGEFFTVISDKHDFLEKFPVLGPAASKLLPEQLVAVTPPIHGNVYSRKALKDYGQAPKYQLSSTKIKNERGQVGTDTTWNKDLQGIADYEADPDLLRAEQMRSAALPTMGIGGLLDEYEDDE